MKRRGLSQRIGALLVFVLVVSGCDRGPENTTVRAVAAGVPSLAPFFDERQGLGRDADLRSRAVHGGLQQGDTPGLYGGTRGDDICDVVRLKRFLTAPENERKARAWASVPDITTDRIPEYLDGLTPVLLRHDTLVKNHDYKKGKAAPFDSLLQAGIAVLVDAQGVPAVKCSCGNPLRPFGGDTGRISVEFDDRNPRWEDYDRSDVVAVRPAAESVRRLTLVDVADPDEGIARPVGTAGERDSSFDTRVRRAVPTVAGATFGQASRRLADAGLAAGYSGRSRPADDARVVASDPPAGSELRFGEYVTLSVADRTSGRPRGTEESPSGSGSGAGSPSASTASPAQGQSTGRGTPSSGSPSSGPPSSPGESGGTSGSTPPSPSSTPSADPPPVSSPASSPVSSPVSSPASPPSSPPAPTPGPVSPSSRSAPPPGTSTTMTGSPSPREPSPSSPVSGGTATAQP